MERESNTRRLPRGYWTPTSHELEPLGKLGIHRLNGAARRVSKRLVRAFAKFGLTLSGVEVLREMCRPWSTSQTMLARTLGMSKGGISKLITRLEAAGLVDRTVDTTDRRCRVLRLTDLATSLMPLLVWIEHETDCEAFDPLDAETSREVTRALLLVGKNRLPTSAVASVRAVAQAVRAYSLRQRGQPLRWPEHSSGDQSASDPAAARRDPPPQMARRD
jgi:DNA-binding MarR family transcriptional regulator